MIQTHFHTTVKTIRTDNGIEFLRLKSYFEDHEILYQILIAGTPKQNRHVERKHRLSLMWPVLYDSKQVYLLSFRENVYYGRLFDK